MFAYKYKRLMEDFINEVITVEDFERHFLNTFRSANMVIIIIDHP
ncbi:colicin immunity domain-containing protein [Neobacillus drentensis]|nr:hypothetical protein [Neobacillus drentensis]